MMTDVTFLPDKALIYATNARGLLIFQEPDFPEIPPQIPGGTIGDREEPMAAARREFEEETGLPAPDEMSFLQRNEHAFMRDGHPHQVNRYSYHAAVSDDLPETWDRYEEYADNGADPILFRFSWVSLERAAKILGIGMNAALPNLCARLAAMP